jgi:phosphatidate phosphatase APP1
VRQRICAAIGAVFILSNGAATANELAVIVYPAAQTVGTPDIEIEGRVVERETLTALSPTDGWWRNLRRSVRRLINDEEDNVTVQVMLAGKTVSAVSDDEGYFRARMPLEPNIQPGWRRAMATAGRATGGAEVLLISTSTGAGVISDVDDTLLVTGVNSKRQLLRNSLLRNPVQRQAAPGMPALLSKLAAQQADGCCVFYLSASPRQLHTPIEEFLGINAYPRGVLVTRRVTNDSSSESVRDQRAYKLGQIERIFAAAPRRRFTLLGDDGEADPEIYDEIRRRHPDRVAAIWIRRVNPTPNRARIDGQGDVAELLRQQGIDTGAR